MGSETIRVRACTPGDAGAVAALSAEFAAYLRALGDPAPGAVTAEAYLRDGFGERPAFAGLVAEAGGRAVVWAVYAPNAAARGFYEALGARYSDDLLMSWPVAPVPSDAGG
jgi:hypothetical protein